MRWISSEIVPRAAAKDFFSPANAPALDAGDLDYGSSGPVGLPVGTTAYPHILVQGGKIGRIFLLNRDDLGGRKQGPGGTDDDLFQSQAYGGVWGHSAVFEASTSPLPPGSSGLSDYVYSAGRDDYLRAFRLGTDSSGRPVLTDAANSTFTFGFSSGSPVVTSNGTDPSSAVVWVVHVSDRTGAGASLVAFNAVPQPAKGGGVKLQQIDSEPIGTASKFTIVAPSNGMIYVGTRAGLYATAPRLSLLLSLKDGIEVGPVPVGQPVYAVTTIVNGGYDLRIPVTFTPATAGRSAGRYTFTWKDRAGLHTLTVPVTATGVR
jgi:hypothetical protein